MKTIRKISLKDYNKMSWDDQKALPKKTQEAFEKENATNTLLKLLPKGSKVYTVLRHVSNSGMTRNISVIVSDGKSISDITFYVSKVLGWSRNPKNGGIKVTGCGTDMGFHLVYTLSSKLYGYENKGSYSINQEWI